LINIKHKVEQEQEVKACDHQNGWREEWLLNSGLTVNLTNKKECF
jgi:hypothetical protein